MWVVVIHVRGALVYPAAPVSNKRQRKTRPASSPRGPRRRRRSVGPRVRSAAVRLGPVAAAKVRAGHPWVFRDSFTRAPADLAAGTAVPVVDEDGAPVGAGLFEPEGAIALRIFSKDPEARLDRDAVEARILAATARRDPWQDLPKTARRVFHGDGEGLPGLSVDRYGEFLVVHRYARALEPHMETIVAALEASLRPRGIYVQDRTRPVQPQDRREPAALVAGRAAPVEVLVEEDGLRFLVDVTAPTSPGLFLDLREGRRWFERLAPNRRVLNLFSYTGAFSLRAVRAGAASVVHVDASARAHARARKNLAESGLPAESCEALVGDVFKHLARFAQRGTTFDLVVADPPPFSRVGRRIFSATETWPHLVEAICGVVAPGGWLLAVKNAAGLDETAFLDALARGAAAAGRRALVTGTAGLPPDFPVPAAFAEGRYLDVRLVEIV